MWLAFVLIALCSYGAGYYFGYKRGYVDAKVEEVEEIVDGQDW